LLSARGRAVAGEPPADDVKHTTFVSA
jgi:hypothetical protein